MKKKYTFKLILLGLLSFSLVQAAYVPVPVTGFNHDVVANGVGPAASSTTADVDGANYAFLAPDFVVVAGGSLPARSLPANGLVNSLTTSGVSWQLADYSGSNALRLTSGTPAGELVFVTPQAAGEVFLLATVGSGPGSANIRVNFTDNTSQLFSGISIPNWYSGANTAIQGIGRVNVVNNNLEEMSNSANPRIYEVKLVLDGAHLQKNIQSISIERLSGGAVIVMGVNINTTCEIPSAQPASLVLNAVSSGQIDGSFTAASPAPDQYLIVRYPSGATPVSPATGITYTPGAILGTGTVVYAGSGTAFSATMLTAGTTYDFYVYAFNNTSCVGPVYRVTAPLSGSTSTPVCSGVSGTRTVGPSGNYPTLTAALTDISAGITGSVVLELQNNYTSTSETFPITISYNACISSTRTLTIRPAAGANGLEITGSNAGPVIDFDGARHVIIDGTPGGTTGTPPMAVNPSGTLNPVHLNIRNTNTAGVAIRLNNGANNNRIRYCDIQGQNSTGANVPNGLAGVVYVGNTGAGGNDRDTIDHCNIHGTTAADLPSIGIYVHGADNNGYTADFNEEGVIADNNIYDFFLAGGNSAGVELNHGVHAWRITGNSFFQTSSRSFTSGGYNRAIWAIPNRNSPSVGNGFVITDNYIGGSAPQCGGSPYTLSDQANYFSGIRLEVKDGTTPTPSVVRNNTITNIVQTTTITTANDPFNGISVHSSGSVDIEGNTIGAASGNGLINIAAGSGSHVVGVLLANGSGGTPVFNVRKNVIGSITLSNSTGNHFSGIFINNAGDYYIDSNLIGSTTTPNSIHTPSTSGSRFMRGISVSSGSPRLWITNNTIANLVNNSTSTTAANNQSAGIRLAATSATVVTVDGNTIHNLISDSRGTSGGTDAAVLGIGINTSVASPVSVSRNTIHTLVSNAPTQGVYMEGIFFVGNNSDNVVNTLDGNFIHSFDVTDASNTAANMRGLEPSSGSARVMNNMVRLGIRPDGTPLTNAMQIWGIARGSALRHYYFHNSVYIGGTGVSNTTGRHTAAFRNEGSGPDSVINNILVNDRTNASGGSNHFSVWMNSSSGAVYGHNVYRYGSGSAENNLASVNSSGTTGITPAYIPGWLPADTTSWDMDPQYIDPDGTAAQVDLHIRPGVSTPAEGTGLLIAAITQDIDGQTRSAFTPVDIGADAGNFVSLPACVAPAAPSALQFSNITRSDIGGSFTSSAGGSDGYVVVIYPGGATPVAPSDGSYYQPGAALGAGTILAVGTDTVFTASGLNPGTLYDFRIYAYNRYCIGGPKYSIALAGSQTTLSCSGPAGVIPVGPTGTYPTLTAALIGISGGITGPVILELQSNYTASGETFPIVIGNNVCFTAATPLTIRPATGANGLEITGSNAGPSILFDSARYVTIDGMPGGSTTGNTISVTPAGSSHSVLLNIRNTDNGGRAIELNNGSSYNTIKYCDLQGQNTTTGHQPAGAAGVVYIGAAGTGGNDNNTISYCNVHSTTASDFPGIGIYSLGRDNAGLHADFNDSNVISNCNIYDYFRPENVTNGGSVGVELNHGVNAWRITDNSFFHTADRIYTSGTSSRYNYGIWVVPSRSTASEGNGFVITGNYIGGSAPQCGGSPASFATASGNVNYTFAGIRVDTRDGAGTVPTIVRGNTITNINLTAANTSDPIQGIRVSAPGSVDIEENIIGGATGNDLISISAASGSHSIGIIMGDGNGGVMNVRKNVIGGITMSGNGNHFSGIFMNTGSPGAAYNLDSNLIGSTTTPNSIHSSSTANGGRFLRGITVPSGYPQLRITNNTIANLTNSGTGTGGGDNHVAGIRINSSNARVYAIDGNTIYNLTSDTRGTSGGVDASVLGIGMSSTLAQEVSVSRNTIHTLVSNAPSQSVYMEGIFFIGNGSDNVINVLDRNFIHSFDVTDASNTGANMRGLEANGGSCLVTNNMVRLGIRPDGTPLTNAMQIWGMARGSSRRHYYFHNSVYIGGSGVGSTTLRHTAAFRNEGTGQDSVINNILVNDRMNASGGSNHFSVWINSSSGLVYGHNIYRYGAGSSTENNLASVSSNGTSGITAAYAPGWITSDTTSFTDDPLYIDPEGSAAAVDLHIQPGVLSPVEGAGKLIPYVTEDFDGQSRAVLSPVDIGADAGDFTQLSVTITSNNSPVCASDTIRLIASVSVPSATIEWEGPNGFSATGTTAVIPNAGIVNAGTYRVWATLGTITSDTADTVVAITGSVTPTVIISANPGTSFCSGMPVTFTPAPTGGGTAPAYLWRKNGVLVGNGGSYTDNSLAHNDVITCRMTSSATCAIPDSAISNALTMTVTSSVTPSVSISANPGTSICSGIPVTFTPAPVNGGTAPVYQWRKNGVVVSTGPTYTDNTLTNGQVITCRMTSNATCAIPDSAISNALTMTVTPSVLPSVSISANPGISICAGTSVTFTPAPVNGGTAPAYQWRKNGVALGTGPAYTDNSLVQGDVITCRMISNATCAVPDSALSNLLSMTVTQLATPAVSVQSDKGTTICLGDVVTFTATPVNGGGTPAYQWYKNAIPVGTNSSVYADNTLNSGDMIACRLSSSLACVVTDTVLSAAVTMQVISYATTITPPGPVHTCEDDHVTLMADAPGMQYQWRWYGTVIPGATGRSYAATETGDYTVTVYSGSCALTSDHPVSIGVHAEPVPLVTVNRDTLTTEDHYTSYQWYVNGQSISGATSYMHIAAEAGLYYVIVTDSNNCTGNSVFHAIDGVSIQTLLALAGAVEIYPNPTSDVVYIRAPFPVRVSVQAADGRSIEVPETADGIRMGSLPDGMYMISVRDMNGLMIRQEKLIKLDR